MKRLHGRRSAYGMRGISPVRWLVGFALASGLVVYAMPDAALAATVRYVSTTGVDTGDCSLNPCRTINYAIAQSAPGDTISIAAGTFAEHVVIDRSVTLRGTGSGSTFVDGSSSGTVVVIGSSSASLAVTISRLTVQNGVAANGGGVMSVPGTGLTNTVVVTNSAIAGNGTIGASGQDALGGGVYNAAGSTMRLSRSRIERNSAAGGVGEPGGTGQGAGVYNAGTLKVTQSAISGNSAVGGGGRLLELYREGGSRWEWPRRWSVRFRGAWLRDLGQRHPVRKRGGWGRWGEFVLSMPRRRR